jgi:HD-GYP domain-containing protein (c-di-GMP phosphodiesterase class II)
MITGLKQHLQNTAAYAETVGKAINLSSDDLHNLIWAAKLHDIGKAVIRQDILLKSTPLTEEEWQIIKKHPETGYSIVHTIPNLSLLAEYILYHHERWDGKGYPYGLKGEEIPFISRIISVADSFDAITTDRTYKKAMNKKEAIAEIERNAGTQFDPLIADIFINCMLRQA